MTKLFSNRSNMFWDLMMFINIVLFIIFIKTNFLIIPFYIGVTCYAFKEFGYKTRFAKFYKNRGK
ncbi:hypothetical protein CBP76_12320 [Companilactobacillus nuruki]|uniref:Uncharacterized protein n=1 Tax=Companilactobacillus nuruki TaxID=1993540 RepID=A0A2N7AR90_9LACO|nr:hypothetical protein CBP76_12320 [Companilactobacillus nuruki]